MLKRQRLSLSDVRVEAVLLAIHPKHAEAILSGRKTVEIRRRFPLSAQGETVFMYATAPVSAIVGGFRAQAVWTIGADAAWASIGKELGILQADLEKYSVGTESLTPIRVESPFRLARPIGLAQIRNVIGRFYPPRSFGYVRDDSLAGLLTAAALVGPVLAPPPRP